VSRIVVVPIPGALERNVETWPLMAHLGDEIADDAQKFVDASSEGGTGRLEVSIGVREVSDERVVIAADARNPRSNVGHKAYAWYKERGTSDTPAEPFLAPATYIYRTP
jgi:hypothetical protein